MQFGAVVKWNGDHYFSGDPVYGSKLEIREDDTVWLYDDEEPNEIPFAARNTWVEVDPHSIMVDYENGGGHTHLSREPEDTVVIGEFEIDHIEEDDEVESKD
ncbi:MAG: hypothetical protein ACOCV8_02385 [Spirochaetota bacterium]